MAAAGSLARKLLPASAGFLGAGAGASASACPAYPWSPAPHGGHKAFMQSDCAACHSMLPHAARLAADEPSVAAAEIVVVNEEAQHPAAATALHGGACTPDLAATTKMLEGLRHNKLYTAQELNKRMALPTPVWLQLLEPFVRAPQAA